METNFITKMLQNPQQIITKRENFSRNSNRQCYKENFMFNSMKKEKKEKNTTKERKLRIKKGVYFIFFYVFLFSFYLFYDVGKRNKMIQEHEPINVRIYRILIQDCN